MKLVRPLGVGVLYIFLLNAPFYIVSQFLFLSRPLINLDYAMLLLVPLGAGGRLALYLVLLAIDCTVTFSLLFHFAPDDFIGSAPFLHFLNLDDYKTQALTIAIPGVVIAIGVQWLLLRVLRTRAALACALVLYLVIFGLDVINGSFSFMSSISTRIVDRNIAGTRLGVVIRKQLTPHERISAVRLSSNGSAMGLAAEDIDRAAKMGRPILLMVAESLGKPLHPALDAALFREMLSDAWVSNNFAIRRDVVRFSGSTTWGELRELCSIKADYRSLASTDLTQCIPYQLKQSGYASIGYHGFQGGMFDRVVWWPGIGLERRYFAEDMREYASRQCGSIFRGLCDDDIMRRIGRELDGKTFIYFLTLNAHFPLEAHSEIAERSCNATEFGKDICTYVGLNAELFKALKLALRNLRTLPLVIIVGDHPPVFSAPGQGPDAFRSDVVPVLIFSPKR